MELLFKFETEEDIARAAEMLSSIHRPYRQDVFGLAAYIKTHRDWTLDTFGPGKRTQRLAYQIKKGLGEIDNHPDSLSRWVDLIILTIDGALRCGGDSPFEIIRALKSQQQDNMARVWNPDSELMREPIMFTGISPIGSCEDERCTACDGTGLIDQGPDPGPCARCKGTGYVDKPKPVEPKAVDWYQDTCTCGAGSERLSEWHNSPLGWTCRECGKFVLKSDIAPGKPAKMATHPLLPYVTCSTCEGSGYEEGSTACPVCKGLGCVRGKADDQ